MTQATKNPTGKDHIFIVSGGRTGTTFFGHHLDKAIQDCASFHEPDVIHGVSRRTWESVKSFGLWHIIIGRLLKKTGIRNLAQYSISGAWSDAKIQRAILAHRKKYYESFTQSLLVEAYSHWGLLLPSVHKVFPAAKSVGVVRDPRDWVRSWLNHGSLYDNKDPVAFAKQERLNPAMVGDMETAALWQDMSTFEKLCWNWNYTNSQIYDFTQTSANSRLYLFEELFGADPDVMNDFLSFCSVFETRHYEVDRDILGSLSSANSSVKSKQAAWTDWTPDEARALQKYCGELMAKLGYGTEPAWIALCADGKRDMPKTKILRHA